MCLVSGPYAAEAILQGKNHTYVDEVRLDTRNMRCRNVSQRAILHAGLFALHIRLVRLQRQERFRHHHTVANPNAFGQSRGAAREQNTRNRVLQPFQIRDPFPVERSGRGDLDLLPRRHDRKIQTSPGSNKIITQVQHPVRRKIQLARRLFDHSTRIGIADDEFGLDEANEIGQFWRRGAWACGRVDAAGGDGAEEEGLKHVMARCHGQDVVFVWTVAADAVGVAKDVG